MTHPTPQPAPVPPAEVLRCLERMNRQLDLAVAHAVRLPIHRRP